MSMNWSFNILSTADTTPWGTGTTSPLTVKDIMIECVALHDVRNKHFVVSSMKDLVENVASQNIVDFIKEILRAGDKTDTQLNNKTIQ